MKDSNFIHLRRIYPHVFSSNN